MQRTVYVVDDDPAVGSSTSFFLEVTGFQSHSFGDPKSFVANLPTYDPGCVLLDIRMPGMDGFQVIDALREYRARLPIIIMTGHGDIATAVRAMKAGAVDFIEKPFEERILLEMLGKAFATHDHNLIVDERREMARAKMASLSGREHEVLNGLISGRSNKVLAYDLGISIRTVEAHRSAMMTRLGVRTLAEALRISFDAGTLDGDDAARLDPAEPAND